MRIGNQRIGYKPLIAQASWTINNSLQDGMGAESKIITGVSVTVNPSFDLNHCLTINQTD